MTHHSTASESTDDTSLVYVRPVTLEELESVLPANALEELNAASDLFAVHGANGQRLAIVEGRDAAFAAARANQLTPTSLH
ncbi:MAG: DUF1150 family protein [Pseudomonadota bacterium]